MALPTLTYSDWRFNVNQDLNTTGTSIGCFRQLIRRIKTTLITASGWTDSAGTAATATAPWVVVASSDSVSASASDLWDADADLVWNTGGTAHSWIILRQTGIHGGNFEVCIDCGTTAANCHQLRMILSHSGFDLSSLSTLSRPPATDERVAANNIVWVTTTATTFDCMLHVLMTDGGECTRVIVCVGGAMIAYWGWDKPTNPIGEWASPATDMLTARSTTNFANFYTGAATYFKWRNTNYTAYMSCETASSQAAGSLLIVANELSLEWPLWPIKLVAPTLPVGVIGELPDAWWGSAGPADGDTYPDTGTLHQFVHFSDIVQPWNQTVPLVT